MIGKRIVAFFNVTRVPKAGKAAMKKGEQYLHRGEFLSALECFDHVTKVMPDYFLVYQARGIAQLMLGEMEQAIAEFTIFLEHDLTSEITWYLRGLAYLERKQVGKAQKDFEKNLVDQPANSDACVGLAMCYFQSNRSAKALTWIARALEIQPKQAAAYHLRAAIQMNKKNYTAATEDLSCALELEGLWVDAYHKRAVCYLATDHKEYAMNDLVRTLYIDQTSANVYWQRGMKQLESRAYGRAWLDFKQAAHLMSREDLQTKTKDKKVQLPKLA